MSRSQTPLPKVSLARDEERAFFRAHHEEFLAKYPDQCVAVRRTTGEVVVVGADLIDVLRQLRQAGIPAHEIWAQQVLTRPTMYVL